MDHLLDLTEILVVQPVDTTPVGNQISNFQVGLIRGASRHKTLYLREGRSGQQTSILEKNGTRHSSSNGGIGRGRRELEGSDSAEVFEKALFDMRHCLLVVTTQTDDFSAHDSD